MATAAGESFDTALVRVPFESLRRTTRERKYAVDELSAITAELSKAAGPSGDATSAAAAKELLSSLTGRLRKLKRSLEEASRLEELDAARVRARIEHVKTGGGGEGMAAPSRGCFVPWTRARFDRMVADDLARRGRGRAARALRDAVAAEEEEGEGGGEGQEEGGPRGLDLLVDWDVYAEAEPALQALLTPPPPSSSPASSSGASAAIDSFGRAEPALEWCRKHAARLKKLRSPLPFRLRLRQFVELALRGGGGSGGDGGSGAAALSSPSSHGPPFPSAALAHAKRHLAPQAQGDPERLADLQRAMLLLVVLGGGGGGGNIRSSSSKSKSDSDSEERAALDVLGGGPAVRARYGDLLSGEAGWRALAALLRAEVARVHEMAPRSQLGLQVAAGLIALKPPPGAVFDPSSTSTSSSSASASAALLPPPSSSSSRDDPLSSAPLAALAAALPHARRLHSQLVCGLTGRTMDDADPPAALPCGATFSESGLRALAGADGCVECPLHGGEREGRTPLSQLRRVFVS